MQIQPESAARPYTSEAANEEILLLRDAAASVGWDPHEVWRTRIKAAYDAPLSSNLVACKTGGSDAGRSRNNGCRERPSSFRGMLAVAFFGG
jgi:hypothetical protein